MKRITGSRLCFEFLISFCFCLLMRSDSTLGQEHIPVKHLDACSEVSVPGTG